MFDQKVGVDLQFRNINAGSNKITVTDDTANNEIDIDVVDANLSITKSQITDLDHYDDTDHRATDQLVHLIAENSYAEVERTGNQVDAVRTYTSVAKTTKIREEEYTYTGNQVTTIVTKQYDGAGLLVETYTETLTYTGQNVDDITGALA